MSKVVRALRMLALATVLVCLTAVPALAEGYGYTVRVSGGNRGSVNGEHMYTVSSDYAYGDTCTLSKEWVTVEDEKYYVKGFRISGKDELCNESFKVTEDVDLVVAYGVQTDMVDYTINFVEYGTGNPLTSDAGRSSVTYKGNVGDKPVVAAEYIEGYRPLYNNITGTLKKGGNVWNLEYVKIETPEGEETTTTEVVPGQNVTTTEDGGTTVTVESSGAENEGEGTEGTQGGAATGEGEEGAEAGGEETETTAAPETQEILDVDNPLAGPNAVSDDGAHSSNVKGSGSALFSNPLFVVFAVLILALVLFLLFFLLKRKKDENEGEA